jgi:hypothetical protein
MPALPCRLMQGCAALLALALWAIGSGRVADPELGTIAEAPLAAAPALLAPSDSAPVADAAERVSAPRPSRAPLAPTTGFGATPQPRLRMGSALGARAP